MAIVKTVKRYGNSGGIYLPNRWIGGKVRAELIEEPPDPKSDILDKIPLEHVISAIAYGSYARKELMEGSDVDILLVVDNDARIDIPAGMKQRYDIQIKRADELRNAVMQDPVLYKVIKDEAVAIINHQFLDSLKERTPKLASIKARVALIESSLSIAKEILRVDENATAMVYPVIMRLKEILLIEYLLGGKTYSTRALKKEILKHGISLKEFHAVMDIYRATRNNKNIPKYQISKHTVGKLVSALEERIRNVRQKTLKKGA